MNADRATDMCYAARRVQSERKFNLEHVPCVIHSCQKAPGDAMKTKQGKTVTALFEKKLMKLRSMPEDSNLRAS